MTDRVTKLKRRYGFSDEEAHDRVSQGMRLVAWRKRNGMTQGEAGKALGIPFRTYQAMEYGEYKLKPYLWLACAAIEKGIQGVR